jgi:hypothetical protein
MYQHSGKSHCMQTWGTSLMYVQYNPNGVEGILSRTSWPYLEDLVIRRNSSLLSSWVHSCNLLFQISLKLIRVRVESGYNKASSIITCEPLGNIIGALALRPAMVKAFPDL